MTPLLTICGTLGLAGFTWLAWELWRAPLIDDADECRGEGQPERLGIGGGADRTFHNGGYTDV